MRDLYKHPSFYAHVANGLLIFLACVMLFMSRNEIKSFGAYNIIVLILLFSAVVGIHGLSHATLERDHDYHPLDWN